MDMESMFTDQKWNILHYLSKGEYSPLQLAEKVDTTISNVSQQLKLLEAANLVKKKKVGNRDRGKPRSLFSLSNDYAYLISVAKDFTRKRLLLLTDYHKAILKIWCLNDTSLHPALADIYNSVLPAIDSFERISLTEDEDHVVTVHFVHDMNDESKLAIGTAKAKAAASDSIRIESRSAAKSAGRKASTKPDASRGNGLASNRIEMPEDNNSEIVLYDRSLMLNGRQ
jgi:predicted transcriptional regulator